MSKWDGKTRGGTLGYKIFIFILKSLGLRATYLLLFFVAFYFIPFAPKSTKSSYRFFRNRMGWGRFSSCIGVYKNYFLFGKSLLDKIASFFWS